MSLSDSGPALERLVAQAALLHPSQRLALLRSTLKHASAPALEDIFRVFPDLPETDALDLIYQEIVLREERKEVPQLDEYLRRFPQWEAGLRRQFLLHDALADESFLGLDDTSAPEAPTLKGLGDPVPAAPLPRIAGYRVEATLGRGAMGVVYKAWQEKPSRWVALKMILGHADLQERRRFLSEIEAAGSLQHPHITQIFHVSDQDDKPFFSMELAAGGTLSQKMQGQPWPPRAAAEMVKKLALAMHHAHERGIVHRDLKPGNVLLTVEGEPKIADFGLAKRIDVGESQTLSGVILGTPSYMAPEQARAVKEIGPTADVYALAAILYEMLTGRPPFRGETVWDTIGQVIADDPAPPRRLQSKIPIDLETIVLKCLHKDPKRRYGSAQGLADDLTRFLEGEPIAARPVPSWERGWMWAKRRPMVAGLLATLVLVTFVGFGLVTWFWLQAEARAFAERQARNAEAVAKLQAEANQRRYQANEYLARVQQAERELAVHKDLGQARTQLDACPPELRGWEWRYLKRLSLGGGKALAVPQRTYEHLLVEGNRLTLAAGQEVFAWNLAADVSLGAVKLDQPIVDLAPVKSQLFAWTSWPDEETRTLWRVDWKTGEKSLEVGAARVSGADAAHRVSALGVRLWLNDKELPTVHKQPIGQVAFHPAGAQLVSVSGATDQTVLGVGKLPRSGTEKKLPGEVVLWDLTRKTGKLLHEEHPGPIACAAFDPTGTWLATAGWDQTIVLWDLADNKAWTTFRRHGDVVTRMEFDPTGRWLISLDAGRGLILWDVPGKCETLSVKGAPWPRWAWNHEGSRLALAEIEGVRPGEISVQAPGEARSERRYLGHCDCVTALAFGGKPTELFSASKDGSVRRWDLDVDPAALFTRGDLGVCALSPDGGRLAGEIDVGKITLWNLSDRKPGWTWQAHPENVHAFAFSGDGATLATSARSRTALGSVRIWNVLEQRELHTLPDQPGVRLLAWHLDQPLLALADERNRLRLWDPIAGKLLADLPGHDGEITALAFAGDLLLSAGLDGKLKRWRGSELLDERTLDPRGIALLAIHGERIAFVGLSADRRVQILGPDFEPESTVVEELRLISALAWSADGKRLLVGTVTGDVAIWETRFGHRYFALPIGNGAMRTLAFVPPGSMILSLDNEGTLELRAD